jgi:hypothetical protein
VFSKNNILNKEKSPRLEKGGPPLLKKWATDSELQDEEGESNQLHFFTTFQPLHLKIVAIRSWLVGELWYKDELLFASESSAERQKAPNDTAQFFGFQRQTDAIGIRSSHFLDWLLDMINIHIKLHWK